METVAWRLMAVAGTGLAIGVLAAPEAVAPALRLVLLGGATACLGMAARRRARDGSALPWWMLTASVGLFAMASAVRLLDTGSGSVPAAAGEGLVFAGYLVLTGATLALARTATAQDTREGLIDGAIVAVSMASVIAVLLFEPALLESQSASRVHLFAGPVVFAAIAGVITRFALLMPRRCRAAQLLVAATVGGLAGNLLRTAGVASGTSYVVGSVPDALLLFAYVALVAAAWHPTAAIITNASEVAAKPRTRLRLALLGGAMLIVPIILVLEPPDPGRQVAASAAALVNILVLWRLGRLFIDRERASEQLRRQSRFDPLTGLPNRLLLQEQLDAALGRARRQGTTMGLLFCDLDGFKTVNDRFGHHAGDRVLVETATRLRSTARAGDTVARLAGDEFVILVEPRDPDRGDVLAQRIRTVVSRPIGVGDQEISVGVSVGVQLATAPWSPVELFEQADRAMYQDKQERLGITS